jgi:hypothetical protein
VIPAKGKGKQPKRITGNKKNAKRELWLTALEDDCRL